MAAEEAADQVGRGMLHRKPADDFGQYLWLLQEMSCVTQRKMSSRGSNLCFCSLAFFRFSLFHVFSARPSFAATSSSS